MSFTTRVIKEERLRSPGVKLCCVKLTRGNWQSEIRHVSAVALYAGYPALNIHEQHLKTIVLNWQIIDTQATLSTVRVPHTFNAYGPLTTPRLTRYAAVRDNAILLHDSLPSTDYAD